ncbi:hypothetical protein O6H91_06G114000 [Diphasiastrum complanatum]|uniref:Uncharacterized protein n=1 Tax=Diphasiastrum complanatum TaxID=34168 RepID=A0ACC2DHL5_DIPCM|nr:hypothetical protein O6H91_06G114000 [Diphasiastrum complanatum]
MADSSPPVSTYGQRLEHDDSTLSLLSRRGSEFGNRYIQADDSGIFMSSLAVTILVSSVATIGILLITLVVTLAVMLGSCQTQPMLREKSNGIRHAADPCASFQVNAEMNNLQGWVLSKDCESYVAEYMLGGQYHLDFAEAVEAARQYLKALMVENDGLDVIVLDIDDTALSNIAYYNTHHYGAEEFKEDEWNLWVKEARAPPLTPTLALYKELKAANWGIIFITGRPEHQRNATIQNLIAAGYSGWASLILRSKDEVGQVASTYKSRRRSGLQHMGYRIRTGLGDQWSDIIGPAAGNRTFKLPNPMYYIF